MRCLRNFTLLSLLACSTVFLGACGGGGHEAVAEEMNSVMKQYVSILADIEDVESANKAVSKLESLGEKMQALTEKAEKLPELSEAEAAKMGDKMMDEEVTGEMMAQMMRLAAEPELMAIIDEPMKAMGGN